MSDYFNMPTSLLCLKTSKNVNFNDYDALTFSRIIGFPISVTEYYIVHDIISWTYENSIKFYPNSLINNSKLDAICFGYFCYCAFNWLEIIIIIISRTLLFLNIVEQKIDCDDLCLQFFMCVLFTSSSAMYLHEIVLLSLLAFHWNWFLYVTFCYQLLLC